MVFTGVPYGVLAYLMSFEGNEKRNAVEYLAAAEYFAIAFIISI